MAWTVQFFTSESRVSDPDPYGTYPHYFELLDPDIGGHKWPTKIEKSKEISCFEVRMFPTKIYAQIYRPCFRENKPKTKTGSINSGTEGFSCSLGVLYGISKLQFDQKNLNLVFSCKLDPDRIRNPNAGFGSALNQCWSETLSERMYRIRSYDRLIRFRNHTTVTKPNKQSSQQ